MIRNLPRYGDALINEDGSGTLDFYLLLDEIVKHINGLQPPSYTVATVPDAAVSESLIIYVSDETGGATIAFSDGTDWRRAQDRAVIS